SRPALTPREFSTPYIVQTYPSKSSADRLTKQLEDAGARAEVVAQRHWTLFYFRQALGLHPEAKSTFPYFRLTPTSPFLWDCLRNSLLLAAITTLVTTLLCLPLARWLTRYRFPGRGLLAGLLLVPLALPPFVGGIGLERFLNRFGT